MLERGQTVVISGSLGFIALPRRKSSPSGRGSGRVASLLLVGDEARGQSPAPSGGNAYHSSDLPEQRRGRSGEAMMKTALGNTKILVEGDAAIASVRFVRTGDLSKEVGAAFTTIDCHQSVIRD